jgi:hypothetical protein
MRSCLRYPLGERRFELTWQILVFDRLNVFVYSVYSREEESWQGVCSASKRPQQKGARKLHLADSAGTITFLLNMRSHSRNLPDALSIVPKYRDPSGK